MVMHDEKLVNEPPALLIQLKNLSLLLLQRWTDGLEKKLPNMKSKFKEKHCCAQLFWVSGFMQGFALEKN